MLICIIVFVTKFMYVDAIISDIKFTIIFVWYDCKLYIVNEHNHQHKSGYIFYNTIIHENCIILTMNVYADMDENVDASLVLANVL